MNKTDRLKYAFLTALEPPPDLYIDEWADKHRILSSEASSEPGPWRTDRFPFMKEIMRKLSPQDPCEEVVLMSGAQVAKTENCLNLMGYSIDYDPCPMLYIQKTVDSVERFSRQRFEKSLLNSPSIKKKMAPAKSRDGSSTMTLKNFPGGVLIFGGANSAASLRSMPIKKLMLDEEDSYEVDIQQEGDPIQLAIRRTANFPGRKIFHISTPGVKEISRIEPLFEEGTQNYYYVPCPFCQFKQTIRWENLKYDITEIGISYRIDKVFLKCVQCEAEIQEHHKTYMLSNGEWRASNPGVDIESYHLSSLYSPLGFYSWKDIVKLWLKYKKNRAIEILKVFINTVLGETFSESGKNVDYSMLSSHKFVYPFDVPNGVKILVAGCDVQDDRIEVEVLGIGDDLETWSIEYKRFVGDTEQSFVWDQLDNFLLKSWKHECGMDMYILGAAVDSGHRAKVVYDFCKKREYRRIFPVKGMSGWGKGLVNRAKAKNKEGAWLHLVYVDEMKSKVYSLLKLDTPGAGYCHFPDKPDYDETYFMMLTAERLERKRVNGQWKLHWALIKNRRNEALDCRNYALAIAYVLYPDIEAINKMPAPLSPNSITTIAKKAVRKVLSRGIQ